MPTIPIEAWLQALRTFYDHYGYLAVFTGTLGENTALLGLFLPGNSLALLGAFYARAGTLNLGWVIFFAWLGTVLGYHVDYLLGRYALTPLMKRWGHSRIGRRLRVAGRIRLASRMLRQHGGKAIFLSHAIGHMRSFIALSAGLTHMKYTRFLFFEVLAALVWNTGYSLLGYWVASEVDRLQLLINRAGWVMLVLVLLLVLVWWWQKSHSKPKRTRKKMLAY